MAKKVRKSKKKEEDLEIVFVPYDPSDLLSPAEAAVLAHRKKKDGGLL